MAKGETCPQPLPECLQRLGHIEQTAAETREDVKAIRTAVVGNGNPRDSLASRVMANETNLKQLRADGSTIRDDKKWLMRFLVGTVGGLLIKTILFG